MEYLQFLLQHWLLSLAFVLALLFLLYLEFQGKVGGAVRLSSSELVQWTNKQNAKLVDVREKGAFNEGHIAGSLHLSQDELDAATKLQKFKDQPIILICATGAQAATAAAELRKQGFGQLFILNGGINAWKAENLPLEKS